jgi:hypothetical protein
MQSAFAKRQPRLVLSSLAVAAATIAAGVLGALPANAATPGASLTLSPSSGTDFTTNAATLSWSLPAACVGQEVDVFLYQGTGAWNANAINTAEGNNGGQQTYFNFLDNPDATSATGSTSWPNVSSGYQEFGSGSGAVFTSTGDLVSALGTGLYTVSIACVSNTTFTPITDSNGNPIATSRVLVLGATGNSWQVSSAIGTQVALKGVGTASSNGVVALNANVTASDGTVPAGGVNFYASSSATGTPLNGSKPVKVGPNGVALFVGSSGYPAGVQGAQAYTAQFVPASAAKYTSSSVTGNVNLIAEAVLIKVTATPDPSSPTSADLTATATGAPVNLATLVPGGGVNFVVDGQVVTALNGSFPAPFTFNSSGVATDTITGLTAGTHTFTAELADANDNVLDPTVGDAVLANTAKVTIGS